MKLVSQMVGKEMAKMEGRVLILSSLKRDGEITEALLNRTGIPTHRCANVRELCLEIKAGAGAVILAREVFDNEGITALSRALSEEPVWSHLPLIILLNPGEFGDPSQTLEPLFEPIKNITFLERPVHVVSLMGVLRIALADRARQYEARRLVRELEESNTALAQFASIASHDLREPLRTISTYIQLFQKRYGGQYNEEGHELLNYATAGARRMQTLVTDLLTFSQVGADKLNLSEFPSEAVVDQVLRSIQFLIKESGAEIVKKGSFPKIKGDELKFSRLIQNLLSNAIKFRRPNIPPVIEIGAKENRDEVILWVADNGIGIAEEDIPKVFRLFQRLNPSRVYPGAGIGLATCQKIVERHEGRISVDSRLGEGSTFSVYIPQRERELDRYAGCHGLTFTHNFSIRHQRNTEHDVLKP